MKHNSRRSAPAKPEAGRRLSAQKAYKAYSEGYVKFHESLEKSISEVLDRFQIGETKTENFYRNLGFCDSFAVYSGHNSLAEYLETVDWYDVIPGFAMDRTYYLQYVDRLKDTYGGPEEFDCYLRALAFKERNKVKLKL